jgi:DNA polymerase V
METAPFHAPTESRPNLDEWIIGDLQASFLMKMEGDAMIEHGIHHGDMLIVERASEAFNNDIVVVVEDGSWSIKLYQDAAQSAEPMMVQAVVKGLVRKYE